jgi:hypothetical protein
MDTTDTMGTMKPGLFFISIVIIVSFVTIMPAVGAFP